MKKNIRYVLLVLLAAALLGIAGRMDYNEAVIYNMPDKVYKTMKSELGNLSDSEIVDRYVEDKEHWDTVVFSEENY